VATNNSSERSSPAAFASLSHRPSRAYCDWKRAGGKKRNAVLTCLARRRVDVLYAMLRTNSPYQAKPADESRLAA
jgi:hypothetical protein